MPPANPAPIKNDWTFLKAFTPAFGGTADSQTITPEKVPRRPEQLGEFDMKAWTDQVVNAIRAVKADQESLRLQNEFFEKSKHPIDTKQ